MMGNSDRGQLRGGALPTPPRRAGPPSAVQFFAVSFSQIVNNGRHFKNGYRASVGPRPTRRKPIQTWVTGDAASDRVAAFWWGHAKFDASIWRMTTGAIYNLRYHRTATSAPRLSPTRFIRTASCHSDKTLFVVRLNRINTVNNNP